MIRVIGVFFLLFSTMMGVATIISEKPLVGSCRRAGCEIEIIFGLIFGDELGKVVLGVLIITGGICLCIFCFLRGVSGKRPH